MLIKGFYFRTLVVIFLFFFCILTNSCKDDNNNLRKHNPSGVLNKKLVRICKNGRWGFIDVESIKNISIAIPPKFDCVGNFSEGLAFFVEDGKEKGEVKFGFINENGTIVIEAAYLRAWTFNEGLARVVRKDSLSGYINKNNKFVIKPRFKYGGKFNEGLAPVTEGNKWGFINRRGKYIIEPRFSGAGYFSESKAPVDIDKNNWGYIDKAGNIIIKADYHSAGSFSEGLARVIPKPDWETKYKNKVGEIGLRKKKGYKTGYIDASGKMKIPPKFRWGQAFSEGYAGVGIIDGEKDEDCGYINDRGKFIIGPKFSSVSKFKHGVALVSVKAKDYTKEKPVYKYFYINKKGENVFEL